MENTTELLANMLELAEEIDPEDCNHCYDDFLGGAAIDLAKMILELNERITRGEPLPIEWHKVQNG